MQLVIGIAFAAGTVGLMAYCWARQQKREHASRTELKRSANSYRVPWHLEAGRTRERMAAADLGYGE